MEQTVTAKIQIKADKQTTYLLEQSMSVYMQACNFVAEYVDNTHQLKQIPLQKAVYDDLRNKFGLMSQKVRQKDRYVQVSWSYYDLETKLTYKAERKGQKVIKVDAHYTSQMCPKCGHTHKLNRDHKNHCFCCRNCDYKSNDDRIGAMNIYQRGLTFIQDYLNEKNNPNNQAGQVCSDGVQSTTLRCNDSSFGKKSKKGRRHNSRNTTGQYRVGGGFPPSSHTTVRTVQYTAVSFTIY